MPNQPNSKDTPPDAINSEIARLLQEWVKLYAADLYRRAHYLTSHHETAEDLVQETLLVATQQFSQFAGKSSPKTWLIGILNHKIADYFRYRARQASFVKNDGFPDDQYFTDTGAWRSESGPMEWEDIPDNLFDIPEFGQVFEACLHHLPDIWRDVLLFKFIENKKSVEICQDLSISMTNYWQIIHRAKLQMRHCLEKSWFHRQ